MRPLLPARSLLLAVFVASSAAQASGERDKLSVRFVMLSEHPDEDTHPIYVKGKVVTTLRFELLVDASKTKMIGWEGRLEPLAVVRNKVILEPLHDLNPDEGIPLIVTLAGGTEVGFLVRPAWSKRDRGWAPAIDQQVDVFKDRESYAAMHAALQEALKKNDTLTEENERYRQEEASADHALAALLAAGAVAQTPFTLWDTFSGTDTDSAIRATVFRGKAKVAVVFKVKNLGAENTWSVQRIRLSTLPDGDERALAMRATSREILPGQSGVVAIVVDGSAFVDKGTLKDLFLELYRQDGQRQAFVTLAHQLLSR
jgi:hypothetical protein